MKNDLEKEQWVEDVMNSVRGMKPAPGDALLYDKIKAKLDDNAAKSKRALLMPRIAAAAAVLVVLVNILSVLHFTDKPQTKEKYQVYQVVKDEISTLTEDNY